MPKILSNSPKVILAIEPEFEHSNLVLEPVSLITMLD